MLNLFNAKAQIDIAAIDPGEIEKLPENNRKLLFLLLSSVQDREAAQVRYTKAVVAVDEATAEQAAAMEAHVAANPAPSFLDIQKASIAAYQKSH